MYKENYSMFIKTLCSLNRTNKEYRRFYNYVAKLNEKQRLSFQNYLNNLNIKFKCDLDVILWLETDKISQSFEEKN